MRAVNTLWLALEIAFERRRAFLIAPGSALCMVALLGWNSGGLRYYPRTGLEFYADPVEIASIVGLSSLFGVLVPLELAAIVKARVGFATATGASGMFAAIASMSCCAPMLLPAVLSFVGFSGTALLGFNASVRRFAGALELASVVFMVMSIALVSRTLTAACQDRRSSAFDAGERSVVPDATPGSSSRGLFLGRIPRIARRLRGRGVSSADADLRRLLIRALQAQPYVLPFGVVKDSRLDVCEGAYFRSLIASTSSPPRTPTRGRSLSRRGG
jgi:hypothetical protein